MYIKRWFMVPLFLYMLSPLVGCQPSATERPPKPTTDGVQKYDQIRTPSGEQSPKIQEAPDQAGNPEQQRGQIKAPQVEQRAADQTTLSEMANRIAEECTRVQGVSKAYVLLTGKTALIGVDLDSQISGSKIDSVKFSVKETAERTGPGYHAVVTADLDTVTRIRQLTTGVRSGKPASTLANEMADILSRLIPET